MNEIRTYDGFDSTLFLMLFLAKLIGCAIPKRQKGKDVQFANSIKYSA